jgi:glycosyltransferase involved in cell wall biosynthesis
MKVLLLSPYDADSHRYWREGLVDSFPEYDWTVITLPPRHFNWRLRGNSLSWAFGGDIRLDEDYDLLIATSMTDLSALRGFKPGLAVVPTTVYFHENQFAYPDSGQQFPSVEPKMLNLYTALAADQIVFNSVYNRDSFLEGAADLLKKLPDQIPPGLIEKISDTSMILPVPLREQSIQKPDLGNHSSPSASRLTVVWNHRWEYDKGPDRLLGALLELKKTGTQFRIHIVGQQFRDIPPVFQEIRSQLGDKIGHWGFIEDKDEYYQLLADSQIVVSTALHDFQGLSVLEAVSMGCVPVVPDRLAYPQYFPAEFLYPSDVDNPELEHKALAGRLKYLIDRYQNGQFPSPPDVSHLSWKHCKPRYQSLMEETAASRTKPLNTS